MGINLDGSGYLGIWVSGLKRVSIQTCVAEVADSAVFQAGTLAMYVLWTAISGP